MASCGIWRSMPSTAVLAKAQLSVYFTKTHAADLRDVIAADAKIESS